MKVHHTGYYVTNIAEAVKTFEKLGYKVASNCVHDESRKISIQFLSHSSTGGKGGVVQSLYLNLLNRTKIARCFQSP